MIECFNGDVYVVDLFVPGVAGCGHLQPTEIARGKEQLVAAFDLPVCHLIDLDFWLQRGRLFSACPKT